MNIFDIAIKDLRYTFSNGFSLVMMIGAPLIVTGLLFFAFGSMSSGGGVDIPSAAVQVVNQDEGILEEGSFQAGEMLVNFLLDEDLAGIMDVDVIAEEEAARYAVEQGESEMAVVIPENFSLAVVTPGERANVLLYHDPTLTITPGILEALLDHFMDGFSGSKVATQVTSTQLAERGVPVSSSLLGEISGKYSAWLESDGHSDGDQEGVAVLLTLPEGGTANGDEGSDMVGPIMAGMTVFFLFFMAANSAQSIIREDETGTLSRLFTTPVSKTAVLGGKFLSVFVTITIQAVLLLIASHFLFGIEWGNAVTMGMVTGGTLILAAGFGILIMSFIKNSRQTGPVLGGVLTLTGMLGGLFTNGIPNLPSALERARLMVPQGWAMQGWELSLSGGELGEVMITVLVMTGLGLAFLAGGIFKFRQRYR